MSTKRPRPCVECGAMPQSLPAEMTAPRVHAHRFRFRDGRRLAVTLTEPSKRMQQFVDDFVPDDEYWREKAGVETDRMCKACQPLVHVTTRASAYFDGADVDDDAAKWVWEYVVTLRPLDFASVEWCPFYEEARLASQDTVSSSEEDYDQCYRRLLRVLERHVVDRPAFRWWTSREAMRERFDAQYRLFATKYIQ